jgi:hypothetical protein
MHTNKTVTLTKIIEIIWIKTRNMLFFTILKYVEIP